MRHARPVLLSLLCLAAASVLHAQFSQTVQFSKLNIGLLTTKIYALPNIGQGSHIIAARLHDSPPNTCTVAAYSSMSMSLEYSVDGLTYFPLVIMLANPNTAASGALYDLRYATGSFPFLRYEAKFDSLDCLADIFYSGSLFPVGAIPSEFAGFFTASAAVSGGNGAVGVASLPFTPYVPGNTAAAHRLAVYGLSLVNGSGSAETVTLYASVLPNCGPSPPLPLNPFYTAILPANSTVVLESTARVPWYENTCNTQATCGGFCGALGTNASGHQFTAQIVYRIDP